MAINILMPALSPTMEEGTLAKWLKKEGDVVSSGDVLAEIETDKATIEMEAADDGVLGKILFPAGSSGIKINTPIAVLLEEDETVNAISNVNSLVSATEEKKAEKSSAASVAGLPKTECVGEDMVIPAGTEMVTMSVREALRDAMAEEMRRDKDVFVIGEEVAEYQGPYKVTQGLLQEFGSKRVIDTPITEMGFTGLAIGAAYMGLRPIVDFMSISFAMQSIDQIVNSAAKVHYMSNGNINVPIVFRGLNGASPRVGAQHSQCYAAWYSHVPGMSVIAPYSAADAKGLLKAAIRDNNPVVFLESEILYGESFPVPVLDDFVLPIGKARICKEGKDVTFVSFGAGMRYVLGALEGLSELGIDAEVIDLRTIRPMDLPTIIKSVKKTGRLVVVEEGFPQSSVGTEVATRVMQQAFDWLDAPVITIAGKDVPMPYAANLEKLALPSVEEVIEAAKAVTYKV